MHKMLDNNPYVIRWASEEIKIPYIGVDSQIHDYFPDYYVEYNTPNDKAVKREIIEVKPKKQVAPPNPRSKRYIEERVVYETNLSKWKSAAAWCKQKGIVFRIFTEDSVF